MLTNPITQRVSYDDENFVVYEVPSADLLIAVDRSENKRISNLNLHYDGFQNIPDKEDVECILFEYDKTKNAYVLSEARKRFPMNQLEPTFVRILS